MKTKSIFQIGLLKNRPFVFAVSLSLIGQLLVIYVPFFQKIFVTESLYLGDLVLLLIITSSVFLASEIRKYLNRRNEKLFKLWCSKEKLNIV